MIAQEYIWDARSLIDDYNTGGTVNSETAPDMKELTKNAIRFLSMGISEMYSDSKNYKEYNIVQTPVTNLLGEQFNLVDFNGDDQPYPIDGGIVGAKSYFFTLDSDATVTVQEYNGVSWDDLIPLTITVDEETDYTGLIAATDTSYPIRLLFSGTTHYRHVNRCLYDIPYKLSKIPAYREWIPFEMPSDFGTLEEIIAQYPVGNYAQVAGYKWEGRKRLLVNIGFEGSIKVIYKPIPVQLTTVNDEVEVYNPIAQQFLRFFVAAKLATTENPDLVNFFEGKANEMKYEALKGEPASEELIQDYYGGVYG